MLAATVLMVLTIGADPARVKLWDKDVPASVGDPAKNDPSVAIYLPAKEKATGAAVVVCPGGGYGFLADVHEGKEIAEWLNQRGIAAFVLKYRIATAGRPGPLHPAPMLDVQRAIRYVRAHAKKYEIDPAKIGVWGFSAGGHLASTAATHFDDGKTDGDEIDKTSCRPDFAILAYPVITMGPKTHGGSKRNLIGTKPDPKLESLYSNETQVTAKTPPTFIFHTVEDKAVPVENARLFVEACKKAGVAVEYVEMEKGVHGIGLGGNRAKGLPAEKWPEKLEAWLKGRELTK